ncbi:uncharacterized protein PITG_20663 [Phytophthora infestans T30-4]|uniref:Uncharacterized protein n=1 Tax=Phytophthora infestans (strain T30-4) TaxID=403677 RepID=D0P2I1_PHYIT|nr:uncharacterized protein PITG_20663 [Phytophthora infestans T30-4]EEY56275.1 conserved hypothetical protein [Phytophthora infestans T30-4]|eukprot:XP_002895498.1 conserved hypothetical protein [Phytophthora infestans T30-4]
MGSRRFDLHKARSVLVSVSHKPTEHFGADGEPNLRQCHFHDIVDASYASGGTNITTTSEMLALHGTTTTLTTGTIHDITSTSTSYASGGTNITTTSKILALHGTTTMLTTGTIHDITSSSTTTSYASCATTITTTSEMLSTRDTAAKSPTRRIAYLMHGYYERQLRLVSGVAFVWRAHDDASTTVINTRRRQSGRAVAVAVRQSDGSAVAVAVAVRQSGGRAEAERQGGGGGRAASERWQCGRAVHRRQRVDRLKN